MTSYLCKRCGAIGGPPGEDGACSHCRGKEIPFKRDYSKYVVLKREDIYQWATDKQLKELRDLEDTVSGGRETEGKKPNTYVVVNEEEPYAEFVWTLIRMQHEDPVALQGLLSMAGGKL